MSSQQSPVPQPQNEELANLKSQVMFILEALSGYKSACMNAEQAKKLQEDIFQAKEQALLQKIKQLEAELQMAKTKRSGIVISEEIL